MRIGRKPHFRFKGNVWSCATREFGRWVIGYGYSIRDAWNDWRRQP